MTAIEVNASKHYTVEIGSGLLPGLGPKVASLGKAQKVCIVSDSTVWPLYGPAADASLHAAGLETCAFVFPTGEASKNGATYLELLNFLAENRLTRTDILIALGGGVSKAGDFLLNALREEVAKLVMYKTMPYARIELAKLGPDAGIIGAAMLGL